jgi:hypothetical protein
MALETGTYISDLVTTNPVTGDGVNQGDDHIRLLKSTVKATFPNVAGAVTPTHTELNYVDGVTSAIQTQLDAKAPSASPTFTGTVTLPSTTSIGTITSTELGYVDGVTSAIQTQLDGKAASSHTHTVSAITDLVNASTTARGLVEISTASEYLNDTADRALTGEVVWDAAVPVALTWTSGGTTTVDLSAGLSFTCTTSGGNTTFGAPTNAKPMQSGFIYFTQDGTTPRSITSFNSAWVFTGGTDPQLTQTISAKDILFYQVISTTGPIVYANLIKNVS